MATFKRQSKKNGNGSRSTTTNTLGGGVTNSYSNSSDNGASRRTVSFNTATGKTRRTTTQKFGGGWTKSETKTTGGGHWKRKSVKSSRSAGDGNASVKFFGFMLVLSAILIALPIFFPIPFIYEYLHNQLAIHELISASLSVVPSVIIVAGLIKIPTVRLIYFGSETCYATYFIFLISTDLIWASVWGVVVFLIGGGLTYKIFKI